MKAVATMKIKIPFNQTLLETMRQYSKSAQEVVDWGFELKTSNKVGLHHQTYYSIREHSDLPAQLVCSSRNKACEVLKKNLRRNKKPVFREFLTIRYDARSFWFKPNMISLTTIKGRVKIPIKIPKHFRQYLDWKVCSADVFVDKKRRMFVHIAVSKDVDFNGSFCDNGKIVGVDVGINKIAVTSERQFFKSINPQIQRFQQLRRRLQAKGTRSAKRHLKRLSGREKRFKRDVNHHISKAVVEPLNAGDCIVMEKLRGIRSKNRGKTMNRLISNWSFYQLQSFIEYKAVRKGIAVVRIPAYYTSQTCSRCREVYSIRPKNRGFFKCLHCGYTSNADFNASLNLRERMKPLANIRGASVNRPIVASNTFSPR